MYLLAIIVLTLLVIRKLNKYEKEKNELKYTQVGRHVEFQYNGIRGHFTYKNGVISKEEVLKTVKFMEDVTTKKIKTRSL